MPATTSLLDDLILVLDTARMKHRKAVPGTARLWQKTQFSNLIRYTPSGTYFARLRVNGKLIRKTLKTDAGVFHLTCPYWFPSVRALKLGANGLSRRAGRANFSAPELRPWAARPEETVFSDGRAAADQLGLGYPLFISFG